MSYFNRNKWWGIAFILLIAMNIATVTTLWLLKERRPQPHMGAGPGAADFIARELGFDSLQKQQLQQLRSEQQEKIMAMREKTRDAKDAFFGLLKEKEVPDSLLEKAAVASSYNDQQMDLLTFRHFQKIRELCTPAQKEKFDAIIKEIIRSMAPPPPGSHPGPPPGTEGDRREPPPPPQQ